MKKCVALFLALMLLCMGATALAEDDPIKIGFTFFHFGDPFSQDVRSGVIDGCNEFGWEVTIQDGHLDTGNADWPDGVLHCFRCRCDYHGNG